MKKNILIIIKILAVIFFLVVLAGMYKFNYLASLPGYDVDGNKITINEDEDVIGENSKEEISSEDMTLSMKEWVWIRTIYNNDTELIPKKVGEFTLTFREDYSVSITTDCNKMGGSYETHENNLIFGPMMSTRMYCEGSQEQEFSRMLGEIQSFSFTDEGELLLDLKFDSGTATFR